MGPEPKKLWFTVTYWWLNIINDFPHTHSVTLSSLYAFWMNHIRRISITKRIWPCQLPIAPTDTLRLLSAWAAEEEWKPVRAYTEERRQLWTGKWQLWTSYTNAHIQKMPFEDLQEEIFYSLLTYSRKIPLDEKTEDAWEALLQVWPQVEAKVFLRCLLFIPGRGLALPRSQSGNEGLSFCWASVIVLHAYWLEEDSLCTNNFENSV